MFFSSLNSVFRQFMARWPQLLRAFTWTALLALTVSIASFAPEMAFVSAVAPSSSSSLSRSCKSTLGLVKIPLDLPGEKVCLPAHMVKRSNIDFFVPTLFTSLVVAASAFLVRSLGLWESETG
ncbi:hypothetical protein PTKIN_Ptkin11bG0024100 [Pterospermum kingtungense]